MTEQQWAATCRIETTKTTLDTRSITHHCPQHGLFAEITLNDHDAVRAKSLGGLAVDMTRAGNRAIADHWQAFHSQRAVAQIT